MSFRINKHSEMQSAYDLYAEKRVGFGQEVSVRSRCLLEAVIEAVKFAFFSLRENFEQNSARKTELMGDRDHSRKLSGQYLSAVKNPMKILNELTEINRMSFF